MKYKASVIGIGQIGHTIDSDSTRKFIWSHAKAYAHHPLTELTAISDPNKELCDNFKLEYPKVVAYNNHLQMLQRNKIQIVSVCAPTSLHLSLVRDVVKFAMVEAIFIEKPVGVSLEDSIEIDKLCKKNNIVLASNYMRRWDYKYKHVKSLIDKKAFGELQVITAYGATSLLTSASHLVDLLLYFGGEISWLIGELQQSYIRQVDDVKDYGGISLIKFNNNASGFLKATSINDENFMFELDLMFDKGRVRILESWDIDDQSDIEIMEFLPRSSNKSGKYKTLKSKSEECFLTRNERMLEAISDIINCIDSGDVKPASNGESAIEVHRVIRAIYQSEKSNQKVVKL